MPGFLKNFIKQLSGDENERQADHSAHTLQLATAALMLELCRADQSVDDSELQKITKILESHFTLSQQQLNELMTLAESEADTATSLYEFTSVFNDNFTYNDKIMLVSYLWEIAYADGSIDRYEDHLIRKVCDLLYVSHSDFIRCKLQVRDSLS